MEEEIIFSLSKITCETDPDCPITASQPFKDWWEEQGYIITYLNCTQADTGWFGCPKYDPNLFPCRGCSGTTDRDSEFPGIDEWECGCDADWGIVTYQQRFPGDVRQCNSSNAFCESLGLPAGPFDDGYCCDGECKSCPCTAEICPSGTRPTGVTEDGIEYGGEPYPPACVPKDFPCSVWSCNCSILPDGECQLVPSYLISNYGSPNPNPDRCVVLHSETVCYPGYKTEGECVCNCSEDPAECETRTTSLGTTCKGECTNASDACSKFSQPGEIIGNPDIRQCKCQNNAQLLFGLSVIWKGDAPP